MMNFIVLFSLLNETPGNVYFGWTKTVQHW